MVYIASRRSLLRPIPILSAGVWTTVYSDNTFSVDDAGWNGLTGVIVIPLSAFSQTGGSQIRLTLQSGSAEGMAPGALWLDNGGGGNAYSFGSASPVQITFGGNGSFTVPANSTIVTDDGIAFTKDAVNTLVISWQAATAVDTVRRRGSQADFGAYFKAGAEASTQNKSGYTDDSAAGTRFVSKVELKIP